jgi:hypothetical protein
LMVNNKQVIRHELKSAFVRYKMIVDPKIFIVIFSAAGKIIK